MRYCPLPLCILSTIVLFFNACNYKCDNAQEYPLQNLSSYVPYTGYDTLRFLHNSTDTQVFVGEGINYFWVYRPAEDDTRCPEDHQSLSIQFRNHQNGNTIKMEYVYNKNTFGRVGGLNSYTFYKFYFNNNYFGDNQQLQSSDSLSIGPNKYCYCTLQFFTNNTDSSNYIFYRIPKLAEGGILKFKESWNSSFELIQN